MIKLTNLLNEEAKANINEADIRKTLEQDISKEIKVPSRSIAVGAGGFAPKKTKDGNLLVVVGLDERVKKISIPQADFFGKEVSYGGYLVVKADSKTGKLLKVIGRFEDTNDITLGKYINEESDPCWDDYEMVGTKTKNGKEVPNCVPKNEVEEYADALEKTKEVDPESLDEDRTEKLGKYKVKSRNGYVTVTYNGKVIGDGDFDRGADGYFIDFGDDIHSASDFFDDMDDILKYAKKNNITEQSKLEEKTLYRPSKRELMAVPQGSTVVVDWNGLGKVSYKVLSKNNKELKLKGMDGRKHKFPYEDYDSVDRIQENISSAFTKAAEKYQEEQLKLQDIVDKQEDVVKKFKKAKGDEKERLKKELIKLHRDQKSQMKKVHQAESKFEKALDNEPVELEESKLRKVKVTYDTGDTVTTSMAANLSDKKIKDYFKKGKEFNIGSGGKDKMAKVKDVEILENIDEATVAYIKYLNKDKGHKEDIKKFKGKNFYDAGQKAKKWAEKNLDSFNQDMIHYESVNMTEASMDFYAVKDGKIYRSFPSRKEASVWLRDNGDKHSGVTLMSKKDWERKKEREKNESTKLTDMLDEINNIKESGCGCGCGCGGSKKLSENIDVFDERVYNKGKGIIIMLDKNGKKTSAIFKNKKNADKYNRNKQADLEKLYKIAKKTPFPKAIDESINEYKGGVKRDGKTLYVDSDFLNSSNKAGTLKHIGMGDFELDVDGGGTLTFSRVSKKFPGFSGRAHEVRGSEDDIKKMMKSMPKGVSEESVNEDSVELQRGREWDIGAGRFPTGTVFYNRAEEEHGDYKKLARVDKRGKINYYDKKLPSFVKKHIEKFAKKKKNESVNEGNYEESNVMVIIRDTLKKAVESSGDYSDSYERAVELPKDIMGAVKGVLEYALRDANFRKEARLVSKLYKKANKNPLSSSETQKIGREIAAKAQWEISNIVKGVADGMNKLFSGKVGNEIINTFEKRLSKITDSVNEAVEPSKTIEKFQKVVDDSQRQRIGGTMVDLTTANIVVQVFNQANDRMKKKLNDLNAKQLINVAFKVIK